MADTPGGDAPGLLHVFIGTVAEYIKTAPLLRLMDREAVPYRLIDSGQHAASSRAVRAELGVRDPDVRLGGRSTDVESVAEGVLWATRALGQLTDGDALRRDVFGGAGGTCLVHGDTVTTLVGALSARRAGLRVAHVEAGLRSHSLLQPFPEELTRRTVSRLSSLLFPPGEAYAANLRGRAHGPGRRARIVPLEANTGLEALRHVLEGRLSPGEPGPAVITMHRLENLRVRRRVHDLLTAVLTIAERWPTRFVVHPPTRPVLQEHGLDARLRRAGVELVGLRPHREFAAMLRDAPLVLTDGGSIQEECAILGVPTVLWRSRTERLDGLGANVVLGGHDPAVVARVVAEAEAHRRPPITVEVEPSRTILAALLEETRGGPP